MIRILQCVNNMHRAGLETLLMNYYRSMDREQIQFDFLMHRQEPSEYDAEIEALGGRIYRAPRLYPQNYPAYFAYMKAFFQEHPEYRIVHSHIDSMSFLPLLAAKRAGVPIRIAHSHNSSVEKDFKFLLKECFRYGLPGVATHRLACGELAGQYLFRGRSFSVLPNAIDGDIFRYQETVRQEKRAEMELGNALTVGHAGRFTSVKNQTFLVKAFAQLLQSRPDAVLLLAGVGQTQEQVRNLVREMGIEEKVRFLGSRGDMPQLYQAMDVFVMPSLFEGVPVVAVEAQFAGLPCLLSDRISREVAFGEHCRFLSLEQGPQHWAQQILDLAGRREMDVQCRKYHISHACGILEHYYRELNDSLQAGTEQ